MTPPMIISFERLAELEAYLLDFKGSAGFIAGGTDHLLGMRRRSEPSDILIDLSQMEELNFIRLDKRTVRIGAATTMTQMAESPVLQKHAFCLAQAAAQMGSVQIRNRATLGGNIGSGSPAADSLPPLTALKATGRVLKYSGGQISYDDHLVIDVCGTQLDPQVLITEVHFQAPENPRVSGFVKVGARSTLAIAKLSLAMLAELDESRRTISSGRVALGALGELPICPDNLEFFLENRKIDHHLGPDLAEKLIEVVEGAIPDRASLPYKRVAVKGLALDLAAQLFSSSPEQEQAYA